MSAWLLLLVFCALIYVTMGPIPSIILGVVVAVFAVVAISQKKNKQKESTSTKPTKEEREATRKQLKDKGYGSVTIWMIDLANQYGNIVPIVMGVITLGLIIFICCLIAF